MFMQTKPYFFMKRTVIYLCFLLSAGLLFSCGSTKTQELVSESSDKSSQIKISGNRGTSFDPFQTSIIINGFGKSDTLITEIYATDLTKETVKFDWKDNTTCTLTFIQQDDSKRSMSVTFSQDGNSLRENDKY
jgi:hypothetical protein